MRIEAQIPIGIAEESVKLTERRISPLITPSVLAILKMDLIELARMKGVPKSIYAA
jgi:hypothetical protein